MMAFGNPEKRAAKQAAKQQAAHEQFVAKAEAKGLSPDGMKLNFDQMTDQQLRAANADDVYSVSSAMNTAQLNALGQIMMNPTGPQGVLIMQQKQIMQQNFMLMRQNEEIIRQLKAINWRLSQDDMQ